jgi:hypothetical protein
MLEKINANPVDLSNPRPKVTQTFWDIDLCTRVLRVPYHHFVTWPSVIKKVYRYYYLVRQQHEEDEKENMERIQRNRDKERIRQELMKGRSR